MFAILESMVNFSRQQVGLPQHGGGKMYVLGIDGGGTKTVCVAARASGEIVGRGTGGPANYLKEGLYTAKLSLSEAVEKALDQAKGNRLSVTAVCAGLAGVGRMNDRLIMKRLFADICPNAQLILENDAFIALVGATEYAPGVIVISGTGSIALGLNEQGETARAGGWGHILGDEGSGYDIARRGLQAALRAHDGRGPDTLIRKKVMEQFYLSSVEELISLLYGEDTTPRRIAGIYPLILEAAEEGDEVATLLIEKAAAALVHAAVAVTRKLKMEDKIFPVAVSGGVFRSSAKMCSAFQRLLTKRITGARLTEPRHPPEVGALLIALKTLAKSG